ncbi:thioredoxin [Fusobacterium sp. PH5-44]|uniref:thioredoxin n=1 Tax=unclassified Fusobacterium TaxID=2648384 RepID=UPI003D1EE3B2
MSKLLNLNEENFKEEIFNSNLVVLDFWAGWCGSCKILNPILEELSEEMRAKIYKVNVDDNPNLVNNFEVKSIPTMIIFKNGEKVQELIGYRSKDEIREFLIEN